MSPRGPSAEQIPAPVRAAPAFDNGSTNGSSNEAKIDLQFAGPIRLGILLEYVSQRLDIQFEYSQAIANRNVSIQAQTQLPISSLGPLLKSVLRTESLAIVDADVPGWKRIVEISDATRFGLRVTDEGADVLASTGPLTQVFTIQNVSAESLGEILKAFLSSDSASLITLADSNSIVVSDYDRNVATIADLIRLVDRPAGQTSIKIYSTQHQSAKFLSEKAQSILDSRTNTEGVASVKLFSESVNGRIIIAGSDALLEQAISLLERLDVAPGLMTEVYEIRYTTAERVDRLARGFITTEDIDGEYRSTIDEEGNLLIVRASRQTHLELRELIDRLDTPVNSDESPIQFYKLKNASAIDVLYSLLALQEAYGTNVAQPGGVPPGFFAPFGSAPGYGVQPAGFPGIANGGMQTTQLPLTPNNGSFLPQQTNPMAQPTLATMGGNSASPMNPAANGFMDNRGSTNANQNGWNSGLGNANGIPGMGGSGFGGGGVASLPGGARVSADISTNSLIVVAPSNVQDMYAQLIESLDQRRPQVLIEAKVIAIDTSDQFTLGVEVAGGDREGAQRVFQFTSFGLSEVDRDTGALRIIPGLGFNGTLIDPQVADVVVRALAGHRRARVLAAPKILVNDNSTGKLESVVSVPFSSVNASQTVSTTSLGGSQQAGTIITATPHINENDHLQLEFDVEFSTFSSGSGSAGLPPARQIDRVGSTVTIPDGKTVVVGGLKRIGTEGNYTGIPWLENIPVIRELTGLSNENRSQTSFFLFIRPIILRDVRFADLEFLSDGQATEAGIARDYPTSRPELIP
jgi:general secretion pathway protein D